MNAWFLSLSPVAQGTLAGLGTWLLTVLGTIPVLFFVRAPRRLMDALMGFAGGVMVAASCWSLLVPAVAWRRSVLLLAAITLHNFPEGLAVGVGYASRDVGAATALAIGIGLQNLPEGLAIALPLRRDGMGRGKAFWYGQLSAVVEPFAALIGALVFTNVQALLPYGMALAAGAMLYVVVEELIPETARTGNIDIATIGFIGGFTVMMMLDNLLG